MLFVILNGPNGPQNLTFAVQILLIDSCILIADHTQLGTFLALKILYRTELINHKTIKQYSKQCTSSDLTLYRPQDKQIS